MQTITKIALRIIPKVLEMGNYVCFVAAPGTIIRGACGRRPATGAPLRTGASASASAWVLLLGSYFLSSDFQFSGFKCLEQNRSETAVHLADPIAVSSEGGIGINRGELNSARNSYKLVGKIGSELLVGAERAVSAVERALLIAEAKDWYYLSWDM